MSTKSNVYSQGGGGNNFEVQLHTLYFISFILGGQIPGMDQGTIIEFKQQSGSLGYQTDDLLLVCERRGITCRILVQAKHQLTISPQSPLFQKVMTAAWKDFRNPALFNPSTDKIFLVSAFWSAEVKKHLVPLLEWAKCKDLTPDFENEVSRVRAKKQFYDYFATVIRNLEPAVTGEDIHLFLRCFEALDYDLDKQASTAKANALTLLRLASLQSAPSAESIWDGIYHEMAQKNASGGILLATSATAYKDKIQPSYLKEIQQLLRKQSIDAMQSLSAVADHIGRKHLSRQELIANGIEKLQSCQILMVTGDAGAGKSAIVKNLLHLLQRDQAGFVIAMGADQLGSGQLSHCLHEVGFTHSLSDIFSCFPLQNNSVIYLDAFEKLLEGEDDAFIQLLQVLSQMPEVKLIISCRKSQLPTIRFRFFSDTAFEQLTVPYLSDSELEEITAALPELKPALDNSQIAEFVRIPKYLDYIYKAGKSGLVDFSRLDEKQLKFRLWEAIVENKYSAPKDGMPQKRREAFIEIAVNRSKKMQAFTSVENADPAAITRLLVENVIIEAPLSPQYCPAHDVLEDWALVRYVDALFDQRTNDQDFFDKMGTAPAMRRAYRLWVADAISDQHAGKIAYFSKNLSQKSVNNHWRSPCVVAILNSPHCDKLLNDHLSILLANDWELLFEICQIMRTACRENVEIEGNTILVPIGHGWLPILRILAGRIKQIPVTTFGGLKSLIYEWSTATDVTDALPDGIKEAGVLMLHLFDNYIVKEEQAYFREKWISEAIVVLYKLSGGITTELALWLKAITAGKDQAKKVSVTLYKERHLFINKAMSALSCRKLAQYLPDTLIDLCRKRWYYTPQPKPVYPPDSIMAHLEIRDESYHLDIDAAFGMRKNFHEDYNPVSAFQTPVYWLLKYHPLTTIDFLTELMNRSVEHYAKSRMKDRDDIVHVTLTLPDGIQVKQTGSYALWQLYRGSVTVTPYILQSAMMALEKYLYELAETNSNPELLLTCLRKLYLCSTSVATTGVISSIVQAFPIQTADMILPLIDQPIFYSWDSQRYRDDYRDPILILADQVYVKERYQSKELPHRRKYYNGLRSFIIDFCINIWTYNSQIFAIIDRMRATADKNDLHYAQLLDDIDRRTWKVKQQKQVGQHTLHLISPEYEPEVFEMVKKNQEMIDEVNLHSRYMLRLKEDFTKKTVLNFELWSEIYGHYSKMEELNGLYQSSGLLAYHGLAHSAKLNSEQQTWVISTLINIADSQSRTIGTFGGGWNQLYDIEPALVAIPRLLDIGEITDKEKTLIIKIIARLAIKHREENDPNLRHFLSGFHNHFWKYYPDQALLIWKAAVKYSQHLKSLPQIPYQDEEQYQQAQFEKLDNYVDQAIAGQITFELESLKLKRHNNWSLLTGIELITDDEPPEITTQYLLHLLDLYFHYDERKEENVDDGCYDASHRIMGMRLKEKLSAILLTNPQGCGGKLLLTSCQKIAQIGSSLDIDRDVYPPPLFEFWNEVAKKIILRADHLVFNDKANIDNHVTRFQYLWRMLATLNHSLAYKIFSNRIFLDIEWKDDAREWPPLVGMGGFYREQVANLGKFFYKDVINLLATIGDKELLPGCFLELVAQLRGGTHKPISLYQYTLAEKLARRLYNHHLDALRQNRDDFEAYIWFLEKLIEEGSTDTYWIMEFVITLKNRLPLA
ncbi:ATP-binding protein [Chitinophaga sp. CF418]|uniref:ATP-binding protein n=1 Tax=Chitinophaga sp. CF418 TaxID=1855287 RepID=UPI00091C99FF|nr:ATP-binding protein [Chitinophaga sp. CF418]SHN43713.1 hypothetical protein SAMN05216311_11624 [Chitinophaga sp. CF418]